MAFNPRTFLTLKALIAIIFCLIGLQYLSLLQVNEKQRRPGQSRTLFSLEREDHSGHFFDSLSEFLHPIADVNELMTSSSLQTPVKNNVNVVSNQSSLEICPMIPPNLHGAVKVETEKIPSMESMEKTYKFLNLGGRYKPQNCRARHRVAIIVPYRDREDHLRTFLYNMHSFLPRQQVDYGIFIVEQDGSGPFNRAMLLNVGAAEALKSYDYQCFIFHDVDLLPEDDRNLYNCPVQPRHMSVAINNFLYRLPYDDIFGGVSAMTVDQFRQVNGFSNMFWGWGGEDDDMRQRIKSAGLELIRYEPKIARYKMIKHNQAKPNPKRRQILKENIKKYKKGSFKSDGLSNLKYKVEKVQEWNSHTKITISVLK